MDLLLARLAGTRPPTLEALRSALYRQAWLTPEADRGVWTRSFCMAGGHLRLLTKVPGELWHEAPCLQARLAPDAEFCALAPRLVALAGELSLGVATTGSKGALWWPAPVLSTLNPGDLERAVAVSRPCESREAWPLLGFALAGPECLELAESHPALAFLLANTARADGRYRAEMRPAERVAFLRELARRPRRAILAALDLPATESMVRLLGKIPAQGLDIESLRLLRELPLLPPAAKALRHLTRFNCGLLRIAVRQKLWLHVGPQLLEEAAEENGDGFAFFQLRDTIEMAEALGRQDEVGLVPSMAVLVQLHERLREDYEARPQRNLRELRRREEAARAEQERHPVPARPFAPPPPVPAPLPPPPPSSASRRPRVVRPQPPAPPAGVVPLRTQAALAAEGREMDHCVATYGRKVERGTYLIYRVLEPERATLALSWNRIRAEWSIDQLSGFANQPVRPETKQFLREWLETGGVDPAAVRWAREQARRRFESLVQLLQQTGIPSERERLKEELARLRVGRPGTSRE
jgi:PcfJ-like protein